MTVVVYPSSDAALELDALVTSPVGIVDGYPPSAAVLELDGDVIGPSTDGGWRFTVVDQEGATLFQIPKVANARLVEQLNAPERVTFEVGADTIAGRLISAKEVLPDWEVQVWRGRELLAWGPIVDAVTGDDAVRVTVLGSFEHLNRTTVGRPGRRNLLGDAGFPNGIGQWGVIRSTGLANWDDPAGYWSIVGDQSAVGGPPLPPRVTAMLKVTNPLDADDVVSIWQDLTLTAPADRNLEYVARALFWVPSQPSIRNSQDLAVAVSNLEPGYTAPLGWYTSIITDNYGEPMFGVARHGDVTVGRWYERGVKCYVPAGRTVVVHVAVQTPPGVGYVCLPSLIADESLDFYGVDVVDVVEGLLDHAQDSATWGHTDRNIDFYGPATPKTISRSYLHDQHPSVGRMITELTSDGLGDWSMLYGPTTRTLVWSWPRRGGYRPKANIVWSDGGGNVAGLEPSNRWSGGSDVLILQSPDLSGFERAEAVARAGAIRWEEVQVAPPETPNADLGSVAVEAAKRAANPRAVTTVHYPGTIWTTGYVGCGDTVNIRNTARGADLDSRWRALRRTISIDDDVATIEWVPEV